MMEDFGDEMESLFVDIIQNVLGCGGAQVSDKKTNMVFSPFYMYHCKKMS
jgi:hypothetical protein